MKPDATIPRQLLDLAWPIIGLNVLTVLALAVDTAMCGRLPDADVALAGLGYATQVVFLLMVAMLGLTVGTIATVARAHGAGQHERVRHAMRQSIQLTILLGIGVAIVGNVTAPWILKALGAEGSELEHGLTYLRPLLTGTVFYYLNLLLAGVLRGVGNTRLAFRISIVINLVNFLLNYGLILGNYGLPALGVQGAAFGTLIAYATGTMLYVVALNRNVVPGLSVSFRPAPIDRQLASTLIRIGWPAAMDMVILNAAFLSIVGMLGRVGHDAVAAHGVGLRIQALAFVPGMSVSQATAAMVGQALGSNDVPRANAVVKAGVLLSTAIMTTLGLAIIAGAQPITALFALEPGGDLQELTVLWMQLLGYGMPIVGVWIAFSGMLSGAGFTNTSLKINLFATTLQIPLSWLLGFPLGFGPMGIWLAFPLSFVVKAALGWVAWKRQTWAKVGADA